MQHGVGQRPSRYRRVTPLSGASRYFFRRVLAFRAIDADDLPGGALLPPTLFLEVLRADLASMTRSGEALFGRPETGASNSSASKI